MKSPARRRFTPRKLGIMVAVGLLHLVAILALLRAFDIDVVPQVTQTITSFAVDAPEEPAPPPTEPEPEGASAPPAPKAEPQPKAAPEPKVVVKPDPPLPVVVADGTESRSGASEAGAGSGGGGDGIGTGSGGSGSGMGGAPIARRAVKIAGDINDARDYPRRSSRDRLGTSVTVFFDIGVDGVPRNCTVTSPSGDPESDRITCQLIEQRFRYRPALDANGRPVPDRTGWRQSFFL
ncbi:energy transducer TonB [Croceicoccus mobilis]|uniref:energy transducer TonB n=1 Tax=Croceicoccus mobilis TaxID=1703339 RepID=UPI000AA39FB8|nr:energy transducer TonB [Croceicoccus mobilis]